jgi:hypothetical protein
LTHVLSDGFHKLSWLQHPRKATKPHYPAFYFLKIAQFELEDEAAILVFNDLLTAMPS